MSKKGWLTVPSFDEENIRMFQVFSDFYHHTYERLSVAPGIQEGVGDDGTSADGVSQAVEEEDDYAVMRNICDPAGTYWQWLHVQVDRWEAVSILSNHATIPDSSMDITLLALKPPDRHPSHCQRIAWESTIKLLIDAKSPSLSNGDCIGADAVIAHLKRKIESQVNVRGEMNSILADFRKLHAGAPHWQAVPHCKAIIASLLTYPEVAMPLSSKWSCQVGYWKKSQVRS